MFTHRIRLFRLLGFTVWIDWSWLLLAVLIVWTLASGYFPQVIAGLDQATYWWMGVAGLIGLAFSIVIHEFAHSIVARRYDMPIRGITLFVFGGVAEMEEEPPSAKAEFWMALAGPVMSFVVAAGFYLIGAAIAGAGTEAALTPATAVVGYLAFINALLAVFNLLPAFPLDGGRILRSALWRWKGDILWATRIAAAAGSGFGFALIALGLVNAIAGNVIGGIWWFVLGIFVNMAARAAVQQQVVETGFSGVPVRRMMRTDPVTVSADTTLDRLVDDYVYRHHYKSFPVTEDGRLVGCVSLDQVKNIDRSEWSARTIRDAMESCSGDNTVAPDADTARTLRQMQRTGNSRLLVVDGGRLVGILALRDLIEFLSIKADLEGVESRRRPAAPARERPAGA